METRTRIILTAQTNVSGTQSPDLSGDAGLDDGCGERIGMHVMACCDKATYGYSGKPDLMV